MNEQDDLLSRLEKSNEAFLNERATHGVGCHKCDWRGYTTKDGLATNCECWLKQTVERMCKAANIPVNYIGMNLEDDWNVKMDANKQDIGDDSITKLKIKRCIAQYTKNIVPLCAGLKLKFPNGKSVSNLLLIGESNSGKTLLTSIIAQEAIKKGLITSFLNWIDLEPIFSDFDAREEQNRIVEDCKNSDLLVIDGVQYLGMNNPYYIAGLERIASARINKAQPTIISAFEDYTQVRGRHSWTSLLDSCHKIYLPSPKKQDVEEMGSRGGFVPTKSYGKKLSDRTAKNIGETE